MTGPKPSLLDSSMPLAEAIAQRVSVRSFEPTAVDKKQVQALLESAVRAPTAMHQDALKFVVIQDRALLKRISDRAKPLFVEAMHRAHRDRAGNAPSPFADPEFDIFHGAGTLIVICGPAGGPFIAADAWLAAENLMLAAHAMGLGTCVIGSALGALGTPEIRGELRLTEGLEAIAPIIVGRPSQRPAPSPRHAPAVLSWK